LIDLSDLTTVLKHETWFCKKAGQTFYAVTNAVVEGKKCILRMHCVLMGTSWPEQEVDHIEGNGLDNRRSKLRVTDHAGNMQYKLNYGIPYKNCKNPAPGVYARNGKFRVIVGVFGKLNHLGTFPELETAKSVAIAFRTSVNELKIAERQAA
jgi:hypothetical protein